MNRNIFALKFEFERRKGIGGAKGQTHGCNLSLILSLTCVVWSLMIVEADMSIITHY